MILEDSDGVKVCWRKKKYYVGLPLWSFRRGKEPKKQKSVFAFGIKWVSEQLDCKTCDKHYGGA